MKDETVQSLAAVVGGNARRLRTDAGVTLNVLAKHTRTYGLKWSTGKVGDLESGRVSPTVPTLFAVSLALTDATGSEVAIADLVRGTGWVRINDGFDVDVQRLEEALRGTAPTIRGRDHRQAPTNDEIAAAFERYREQRESEPSYFGDIPTIELEKISKASGLDEDRVAADLDISPDRLLVESYLLWGRAFSAERDARAGEGANAQKRGHISRALKAELAKAVANGHD